MGCSSCGGGARRARAAGGQAGRGIASRKNQLPFVHVKKDAKGGIQSRVPYATKAQAEAAARAFGGEVQDNV